jgi:shikimate dehydrogenase
MAQVSVRLNFAVIGDPVEHSLSPRLFRMLFDELGVAADYRALRTPATELPQRVKSVRSGELTGISVTVPHKETIIPLLDDLTPPASLIGAVNCLARKESHRAIGYNTDGQGFRAALEQAQVVLQGARMLILGSGGAARAAAFTAAKSGVRSLTLVNRSEDRASRLALDLTRCGLARPATSAGDEVAGGCTVAVFSSLPSLLDVGPVDVIVNATTVGLGSGTDDPLPPSFELSKQHTVMDMVYRPLETRLIKRARAVGAVAIDGLWMLVHQALEQFRLWTSRSAPPDIAERIHSELSKEAR